MKDRIKNIFSSFFISVTLINAAMLILGMTLHPEQKFGYEAFMYPLIYGLIGTIPSIVIDEKKELSVPQTIVGMVMRLLLLIVLLLAFMFGGRELTPEIIKAAISVSISVVIIYVLVNLILWWLDLRIAKSMTEDLVKFQKEHEID